MHNHQHILERKRGEGEGEVEGGGGGGGGGGGVERERENLHQKNLLHPKFFFKSVLYPTDEGQKPETAVHQGLHTLLTLWHMPRVVLNSLSPSVTFW